MASCYCKKLSPLLREITSKHDGNFYRLNCFHSYTIKNKLKKYEDVYKNIDYCYVDRPKEYNENKKYNYGEKPVKVLFIIYADMESFLEKISTCHNKPI